MKQEVLRSLPGDELLGPPEPMDCFWRFGITLFRARLEHHMAHADGAGRRRSREKSWLCVVVVIVVQAIALHDQERACIVAGLSFPTTATGLLDG